MFKKMIKSRKGLALSAIAGVLALGIAGGTYAWLTSSVQATASTVEIGKLKITAAFEDVEEDTVYEPGLSLSKGGEIKNLGTIPAFVKISTNATVTKRSDMEGETLDEADYVFLTKDSNVVSVIKEAELGYKEDGDNSFYWYRDTNNPGDYYIMLLGDVTVDVDHEIEFNGPGMGNDYNGALINFQDKWTATQALDEAVLYQFGISFSDLEFIDNNLGRSARSVSGESPEERAAAIFYRAAE